MKLLHKYQNGNVNVEIYDNGTKIREWPDNEEPNVAYPESCDLKITQFCDLDSICVYCHEMSNKKGQHGDLNAIDKIWQTQMPGTELAIGGGNPLAHPELETFLRKVTSRGIIPNVTVNMLHMKKFAPMITKFQKEKLMYGLGISYRGKDSLKFLPVIDYKNVVFHMILGVHDLSDCQAVIKWCQARSVTPKMLLLGYKTFGNGAGYYHKELQDTIDTWKSNDLATLLSNNGIVVSFDNLAIEQLDLQAQLPKEQWDLLYQGMDGSHTLYCCAVTKTFARTSTSVKRYDLFDGITPTDMINIIHEEIKSETIT